jgi:hypothetical protein
MKSCQSIRSLRSTNSWCGFSRWNANSHQGSTWIILVLTHDTDVVQRAGPRRMASGMDGDHDQQNTTVMGSVPGDTDCSVSAWYGSQIFHGIKCTSCSSWCRGKVKYDAIARQGHNDKRIVHASFKDLIPLRQRADGGEISLDRPSDEEVAAQTEKRKMLLQSWYQEP